MTCWFVPALITECFRARCLRRASKLLRPSPRLFPHLEAPDSRGSGSTYSRPEVLCEQLFRGSRGSGSSYLEAPEASGAVILRLQRLWEQPSRGSRGSGSSHLEVPEAIGSESSEIQAREALEAPVALTSFLKFSRVFSSLGVCLEAIPAAPGGSRRPSGGFEGAQERVPVASSGLESAPKWPRSECFRSGFEWSQERSRSLRA